VRELPSLPSPRLMAGRSPPTVAVWHRHFQRARYVRSGLRLGQVTGLTQTAMKAQWPLTMMMALHALLAVALIANAVVAFVAISKLAEPAARS
jgi:hypothetical protein